MNKKVSSIIGIAIIVFGISMIFNIGKTTDHDEISIKGIETIMVSGSSEEINIIPSSGNDIEVELDGKKGFFGMNKAKVKLEKKGNTVEISVKRPRFSFLSFSNIEMIISVPSDYDENLKINLSSGSVELNEGFELKEFEVKLSSGDINVDGIKVENANISVSSGSLNIKDFTGEVDGKLSSGDILIDFEELNDNINFGVSSGSLIIGLPEDSDFELDANMSSGSINCEIPLDNQTIEDHKLSGTAGNGNNNIKISISSGDVSIREN